MNRPAQKPAPRGADKYRSAEIIKIQIAKRWAIANLGGFDDETYRDMLYEAGGGTLSSTELDWRGRMAMLKRFEELGWTPKPAKAARPASGRPSRRQADDNQSRMIRGLWIELHTLGEVRNASEKALTSFVKRMTRIADLHWLSDHHKNVVIEALKDMRARRTVALLTAWVVKHYEMPPPESWLPDLQVVLRGLRIGEHPEDSAEKRLRLALYTLLISYKDWEGQTYGTV